MSSLFKPAWWLPGAHAQTIWPSLMRTPIEIETREERLTLPDGDFIDLEWTMNESDKKIIVLHGLEGSIESSYARGILKAIQDQGWQAVFMHFRGCSGEHNIEDRSYHSGETSDIRFLIDTLTTRDPNVRLCAIGYSLGGNALLKYLGETRNDSKLESAVTVSVPYKLERCSQKLKKGFSRIYQRHLVSRLLNKTRDKFIDRQPPFDLSQLHRWKTFQLFDHHVTAPLHGFESGHDYYTQCSSYQFLKYITTPALLIHALDDPFMTRDVIPKPEDLSESIQLELSNHGGHVGFVSGNTPWNAKYWLEQRIPEFLGTYLD